jgi:probable F420-dependent oxidoreductase
VRDFGRFGLWIQAGRWPAAANELAEAAQEIESLGYGSVWVGGHPGDDLVLPEAILAATTALVVGTSIIDVWRSDPGVAGASHRRVQGQFPGRFYLGLGSGHAPAVEATGQAYVRPLSRLRHYLDVIEIPAAEVMLAALGPRALATARDRAAGALPYLVPPEHTADARAILGPDRLLVPEQKVVISADEATARAVARRATAGYLRLPNYLNNLRRYGLTDDDFTGGGSDRWVDRLVAWGDAAAVRGRLDAHRQAGADHVAVQVLSASAGDGIPLPEIRTLATSVLDLGPTSA